MNIVNYLADTYGYGNPIFIKDLRIGKKSKTAIKMQISRAFKAGDISRDGPGVYSLVNKSDSLSPVLTFEKLIENKFLYDDDIIQDKHF